MVHARVKAGTIIPAEIRRPRRSRQSGSILVEAAVTLPVLILLMFGVADLGRLFFHSNAVAGAARAAVSYVLIGKPNWTDTAGIAAAANGETRDVSSFSVTSSQVCTCSNGTVVACSDTGCTSRRRTISVTVQAPFSPLFTYPGIPTPITVAQTQNIRVE